MYLHRRKHLAMLLGTHWGIRTRLFLSLSLSLVPTHPRPIPSTVTQVTTRSLQHPVTLAVSCVRLIHCCLSHSLQTGTGANMGTIRLGGYKRHHDDLREFKSSLTYHTQEDNGREALVPDKYEPSFKKGLATTKFCSGFMRRQESEVVNDLKVTFLSPFPPYFKYISKHPLSPLSSVFF